MKDNCNKKTCCPMLAALIGFAAGFTIGAAVVAVIDYHDEHKKNKDRISKGSDENYISS